MTGLAYAVVVPLKAGARARVQELLAPGPPFDPGAAGLESHHVLVTDDEAIFVFEAAEPNAFDRLATDATVWPDAAAWQELAAGPPRVAQAAYAWHPAEAEGNVSFAPTPGPGDSEGGDVFAP